MALKTSILAITARVLGGLNALFQAFFLMLALNNPFGGGNTERSTIMSILLVICLLGYLTAWKKPKIGGSLLVFGGIAMLITYFLTANPDPLATHLTPMLIVSPSILIGALFLYSSR